MSADMWDCHVHVFGPFDRYPLDPNRLYTPARADCDALEVHLAHVDAARVTIVQPSPYASDHRCLLAALERLGSRARGIAAWQPDAAPPAHRAIVGLRVHVRATADPLASLALAGRAAADAGRHLEVQGGAPPLDTYADALARLACPIVLDHLAGLGGRNDSPAALDALARLLDTGRVWVKYSAPYRASGMLAHFVERARWIHARHSERLMWGSDWPHTPSHPANAAARMQPSAFRQEDARASRAEMLAPFETAARAAITGANAALLYGERSENGIATRR